MTIEATSTAWQQVHNVVTSVAHAQDEHDWERLARCFALNARYVHPKGELAGQAEIVARSRAALEPLDASQHLVGSIHIVVEGDLAHATSYFQAQHVRAAATGGSLYFIAGTYTDEFAVVNDQWVIVLRTQTYSWRDGNPDVIVRKADG
ncbi:MAG: nuclear transport factor 2 family protein [Candidatus Nanopelagicales bacterium]|jgi:hypothetical protein|nr:nuclear transport factor 2 family protein [Candidatus Nanopelagicales bacterium]